MAEVGLTANLYDELPLALSTGERQRISIARALILGPKLLILDETLSALDQGEQGKLIELFSRLQRKNDLTYVFISHDLAMVRKVCTRIAVMYLGEMVEVADNHELFFDPQHPYTKALLSAAPTLEDKPFDASVYLLDGEPPSPIDIPPGCSFASRCPKVFDRCLAETPQLSEHKPGRLAACHLLDRVEANAATTCTDFGEADIYQSADVSDPLSRSGSHSRQQDRSTDVLPKGATKQRLGPERGPGIYWVR